MAEKITVVSFMARCAKEFRRPGASINEFAAELKELTHEDKVDLCKWFNKEGLPTLDPMPPKQ